LSAELIVREITNAAINVTNIVIGIYAKNFHKIPGSVSIGKNAKHVVAVQAISEYLYSLTANSTADIGLYHSFSFSCAHSITTIVVSMAIQKQIIKLKFVKKFIVRPSCRNTKNVIQNARGIVIVAIIDSLNPTNISKQINTITTVCNQLLAKSL